MAGGADACDCTACVGSEGLYWRQPIVPEAELLMIKGYYGNQ